MEFGWINLLVWKFAFGSVEEFLIYLIGNGALLLRHWLLVAFAILFGACHCTITYMTHKEC